MSTSKSSVHANSAGQFVPIWKILHSRRDHPWNQLLETGSEVNARAKGTLRLEGKDYTVQDGDVMYIRHSA